MNLITFLIEKYSYKLISQNIAINLNINSSTQKSNIRNYKCPSIFNSSLSKSAQAWHLEYKLIFIQKVIPISVTWYIIYIHIYLYMALLQELNMNSTIIVQIVHYLNQSSYKTKMKK